MVRRPETLDEVDWEAAADALIKSARNMSNAEVAARAEAGAASLDASGHLQDAEALRRTAAVIRLRLLN